jgi:PAS domain S-box-containing protein
MPKKMTYAELEAYALKLKNDDAELRKAADSLNSEIICLRLLVEQSRDGIVVLDQNGKVYNANKRYADMLGYSIEEIFQLHVWDWDFLYDKEQLIEMIRTIDDSGAHFETQHRRKDGTIIDVELSNNGSTYKGKKLIFCICRDITDRKREEKEKEELIVRLQEAMSEIKSLRGILPICSVCKKIRNDKGSWEQIEAYIRSHSEAVFSHGICPECAKKQYPEFF